MREEATTMAIFLPNFSKNKKTTTKKLYFHFFFSVCCRDRASVAEKGEQKSTANTATLLMSGTDSRTMFFSSLIQGHILVLIFCAVLLPCWL